MNIKQKKSKHNPEENSMESIPKKIAEKPSEPAELNDLVIIKTAQAAKLSPKAKGQLTYAIGYSAASQTFWLRIQGNASGGIFSNEWIAYSRIYTLLQSLIQADIPFSASRFKPLIKSQSQNNAGFLAAIIKAEGIIKATQQPYKLTVSIKQLDIWQEQMLVLAQPWLTETPESQSPSITFENPAEVEDTDTIE